MVYSAMKAGREVNWALKATETSCPGFLLSPVRRGPFKNVLEIATTRLASTFTPSLMNGKCLVDEAAPFHQVRCQNDGCLLVGCGRPDP